MTTATTMGTTTGLTDSERIALAKDVALDTYMPDDWTYRSYSIRGGFDAGWEAAMRFMESERGRQPRQRESMTSGEDDLS